MSTSVNRVRNAAFARGTGTPAAWEWHTTDNRAVELHRSKTEGIAVAAARPVAEAKLTQTMRCKPKTGYRVEAVISADLTAGGPDGGCVLTVEARGEKGVIASWSTSPLRRSTGPTIIRTYFETPAAARELRVSIGLRAAAGTLRIHEMFACWTLDHEAASHPLAIPPPATAVPARLVARNVAVVSAIADERPVTSLLRTVYGQDRLRAVEPSSFDPARPEAEAVLLPDAALPAKIRRLSDLFALADRCMVVVSLPAFAALSGGKLRLRRVEQADDPIHARVEYANFATRGFALHDAFALAWQGKTLQSQRINQFRKTPDEKAFLKRHGLITMLTSLCDTDANSGRPICLYREGERGGLFVYDIESAEAAPTTMGEPALAVHLLLSMLGRQMHALGQYVMPVPTEARLRDSIREMPVRFIELQAIEEDLPVDELDDQLLLLGHEDRSLGLLSRQRPVVLVRSGLAAGDLESVYGAWWWFKQLVRMSPHRCGYVEALASQLRVAWQPLSAPWEQQTGFARSRRPVEAPLHPALAEREFAMLLDVVSVPGDARVVVPSMEGGYSRYATWLPRLTETLRPGRHVGCFASADPANRDGYAYREAASRLTVSADPSAFTTDAHRVARERGAELVRIETPACDTDFAARSIWSTDLTATLVEHVVGLAYGLIAVNRSSTAAQLPPFSPIGPGEALVVPRSDRALQAVRMQAG